MKKGFVFLVFALLFVSFSSATYFTEVWSNPLAEASSIDDLNDGNKIVVGDKYGGIKVLSASDGSVLKSINNAHAGEIKAVDFSPDGTKIVSGSWDNTVKIWDANSLTLIMALSGHTRVVRDVSFSPDGSKIASLSDDSTLVIWDANTGGKIKTITLSTGSGMMYFDLEFSPDGNKIAVAGNNAFFGIYSLIDYSLIAIPYYPYYPMALAFSPDGSKIASAGTNYGVSIHDANTGSLIGGIGKEPDVGVGIMSLDFSSDGKTLLVGEGNTVFRLYDVSNPASPVFLRKYPGDYTYYLDTKFYSSYSDKIIYASNVGVSLAELTPLAQTSIPNAPSKLSASANDKETKLSWIDNSNNEAGFLVEMKLDRVNDVWWQFAILPADSKGMTITNANLNIKSGYTATYRVRAYNHMGYSPYSSQLNVKYSRKSAWSYFSGFMVRIFD